MRNLILIMAFLVFALFITPTTESGAQGQVGGGFQGGAIGQQGGGFQGPGLEPMTVAQAIKLRDDSYVILTGTIVRHLGKDKYLFQDATGEINLDIDSDKWMGQNVTPAQTVEIRGEIDKDWNSIEVEVDRVTVVK
jgi:uncharacterized protein (TIGR00156 family)